MKWTVPLACLLAVTLTGCVRTPDSTALDLVGAAQGVATGWQPDARLRSVAAYESANGTVMGHGLHQDPLVGKAGAQPDPAPGDGRAASWLFQFTSEAAGSAVILVLDAQGEEVARNETSAPREVLGSPVPVDLAQWRIDSDEATDRAAAANSTFRLLREEGALLAYSALFQSNGSHPLWILALQGDGREVATFVDASNGDVIAFPPIHIDFGDILGSMARESGTMPGRITALEPTAAEGFRIDGAAHQRLAIAVRAASPSPPGQGLTVLLTGPEGASAQLNHTTEAGLDSPSHVVLEAPVPGDYGIEVRLAAPGPSGVAVDYEVSWCTDGADFSVYFLSEPPPACDHA
jgi:hypothetical protein